MKQFIYPISLDKRMVQNTLNKSLYRYEDEYKENMVPLVVGLLQKVQIQLGIESLELPCRDGHPVCVILV